MFSQGAFNPSSVTVPNPGNGAVWANLDGMKSQGVSVAQTVLVPVQDAGYSDVATLSGFGFSVPADATVTGVMLEVRRKANVAGKAYLQVNLFEGPGPVVTGVSMGTSFAYEVLGGPNDGWQANLTPALVNALEVTLGIWNTDPDNGVTVQVDHVKASVFYTTP